MIAEQDLIACVDLGSNSFRLQICRNANGALQVVDSVKETVRMAAGLDSQKNLADETRKKALHCLMRFGERLRGFSPERVRAVATNSFRVMNNVSPFLRDAEAALAQNPANAITTIQNGAWLQCKWILLLHPGRVIAAERAQAFIQFLTKTVVA